MPTNVTPNPNNAVFVGTKNNNKINSNIVLFCDHFDNSEDR